MSDEINPLESISSLISFESLFNQDMVSTILGTLDLLSPYTRGRTYRVTSWARMLGEKMGMDATEQKEVEISALFCDIGMWAIPNEITLKKGRLTLAEFKIVHHHPELSLKALAGLPLNQEIHQFILHHHEKHNGHGYPHHLQGNEIPVGAQVVHAACTLFALTTERPHRVPVSIDKAVDIIDHESGLQFSPEISNAVVALHTENKLSCILENKVHDPFERVRKQMENSDLAQRISDLKQTVESGSVTQSSTHSDETLSTIRKRIIENL